MGTRARGKQSRPRGHHAGGAGRDADPYNRDGNPVRLAGAPAADYEPSDRGDGTDGAPAGTATRRRHRSPSGSRASQGGRSKRARGISRSRRLHWALRWSATVLAILIVGSAGAGYLYYRHLNGNIRKDALNLGDEKDKAAKAEANEVGQTPLNILLIGSDARDTKENQKLGGARNTFNGVPLADVQMLLHVSADRSNLSVVSMPRDTLLQIPRCTDPHDGKVYEATVIPTPANESLGRGGPGCTVATWEKLTGIHIDHFMQIDFSGVVSMADAIGGVPVCVDADIHSRDSQGHGSGLKLTKGTHPVKGKQALQWLRTRYGFGDGSDLMRARAQHMYMNSMVRQLRENATLTNPGKLRSLAETATKALTVDDGLGTVKRLYDLAVELRRVPTRSITMTTMPNQYAGVRVKPTPDAFTLFRLLREDISLTGKSGKVRTPKTVASHDPSADDSQITVLVRNGTRSHTLAPVEGRANEVTHLLTDRGFLKATADTSAAVAQDTTMVRYPHTDLEGDAQRLAKVLGIPASSVTQSPDVTGVTLVVGADWRSGTAYKAQKEDNRLPDTADALNGADSGKCMPVNPNYIG
ncbi:LCP family protein [Streptomyces sp. NPDC001185]|uniref:LCP family protein n=1 Tax=Streptomyces sp. NPDC001185 TaxID=3154380 RepID=UPI00331DA8BB